MWFAVLPRYSGPGKHSASGSHKQSIGRKYNKAAGSPSDRRHGIGSAAAVAAGGGAAATNQQHSAPPAPQGWDPVLGHSGSEVSGSGVSISASEGDIGGLYAKVEGLLHPCFSASQRAYISSLTYASLQKWGRLHL